MSKTTFQINGMTCSGCAMTVEGALEDLPGVRTANASVAKQTAEVEYDETKVTEHQMIEAIQQAGYSVA
jgi:copper chaperone